MDSEEDRTANGVPLHLGVVEWSADISGELSTPKLLVAKGAQIGTNNLLMSGRGSDDTPDAEETGVSDI